ncbi:cytochrome c maturation protein CcmE [Blastochloris viridis]|uniref:Cytochrome c-type biogenesis protein CcmE n=1 Tax=Blastochloris viridis TaxID=1079 RepID=A0A0H5BFU9_BLAVI|nr:cytochrome c maturation protein CcmE [Blastochloris viridis]ALK10103.1 Cytochrome c-type biogenesis protein CcmE [Blastochloris viridis]BAR99969.1 cytochrome c-type biogenesis protein CcmE [Blastochloris viridis]CUU42767.1 Heme chaperone CcmE [Blastochloris viridis]
MTRKQRRLALIGSGLAVLAVATGLVLVALNDSIVFFNSPTDVVEKGVAPGERIRLGGLVANGTIERGEQLKVRFKVTDGNKAIPVAYTGILPDLFREGQGVVTEGSLGPDGVFLADTVLAKHDENYMPREVTDALKKQGHWQGEGPAPGAAASTPSTPR